MQHNTQIKWPAIEKNKHRKLDEKIDTYKKSTYKKLAIFI
ncbi:hypothetical protein SPBRAN_569 [uncultured Candidatus Thioglobus sp.]|nr:hypothetical protein SPBRAN_569 [uncultured Candidatus Thioglobus sp.]